MKKYSDYIIYVDESGDHSLGSIDPGYPVFVLDFCIFQKEHYANVFAPRIQEFKFAHFGHDIVILHEHDIRKQKPPFVFLQNQEKRARFMDSLNQLIEQADFTIIAAAIHKTKLVQKYIRPYNPYELALKFCMERAHSFLCEMDQEDRTTHIIVERRGKREDADLELAFHRICNGENLVGPMPGFEIIFAGKETNSAGLQLADLTARPIGRHVLDGTQKNRAWDIIRPKMYGSSVGSLMGLGLKVFP